MDEVSSGESHSVLNGIEHNTISHHDEREVVLGRSRTHRHHGALKAKSQAYTEHTNKTVGVEQTDFMIQQLERRPNPRLRQSYANGRALEEVVESAPVLSVGLAFLAGADKPQVTRGEQVNMEGKEPDQKDTVWRVNTAGSLLSHVTVSPDLQIIQTDQTASVLARIRAQSRGRERFFQDQKMALSRRSRYADTITIDSERVAIVKDLRGGDWDIRGLLVEVDWSSLWDLMINYRNLIAGGGPEMTFEETRTLLETMIEDARRLCIRSPILFRMSTRARIIDSENTRYGVNHGAIFRTLTTSKGIREIISLSASYFNSLDPHGSDDTTQKYIRPRFLQMIVLLLSFLNNEDLSEIKDFLEATYKLRADRRDIELLILKVIPLISINPRVFLKGLVLAIDAFPLESGRTDVDENQHHVWNIFVKRILGNGYILPGTVDDLGRSCLSWIVKWPEDGLKSTSIFNSLQYAGRLRTINDIPPVEVYPASHCTELTVVMTDDSKYVISPRDLELITYMTPGVYALQETAGRKKCHDLTVQETWLNGELYQAIKMTNDVVDKVNHWLASRKSGNKLSKMVRRNSDHQPLFKDFRAPGKLEEVVATLQHTTLAITYKIDGRKIGRIDAAQSFAGEIRLLRAFISHIEQRADISDHSFFNAEKRELKQSLDQVKVQIDRAEQSRMRIGLEDELSNEPIVKCLYPEGADLGNGDVWHGYKAWCHDHDGCLYIEGTMATVGGVRWLTAKVIELSFVQQRPKIFVTTLKPIAEGHRADEVRAGDIATLVGHYVAIGEKDGEHASGPLIMTNYLKIVSVEEQSQSRRGKNREGESESKTRCCFR